MITQPIPKPKLYSAPAARAVLLATFKTFLRVDTSDEDTMIGLILDSAIQKVEKLTSQKLINQTWDIFFDHFPRCYKNGQWWDGVKEGAVSELYAEVEHLDLPFGPLSTVALSTFTDDGTETVFSSSSYIVDTNSPSGRVSLKQGQVWPSTVLRATNGIKVRAVFGYGAADTAVPSDIQMAIMTLGAKMYEHRGDELPEVPAQVLTLLSDYIRIRI